MFLSLSNARLARPGRSSVLRWALAPLVLLLGWPSAQAFTPFTIEAIQVQGLTRIAEGTVYNYLPLSVGDRATERSVATAVRALFGTGFFADVVMDREDSDLVVRVRERPAIGDIAIVGNVDINEEELLNALRLQGVAVGQVYDQSLLEQLERELLQQYFARGKYSARVEVSTATMARDRVRIGITISEGLVALIKRVRVIGNAAFTQEELLAELTLADDPVIRLFSDGEQYSKEQLSGDLEALRSRYLNDGYLNFRIDSVQVALSADKKSVFITINITEGERYTVSEVTLVGDLPDTPETFFPAFKINAGEVFSRRQVVETANALAKRLGNYGFAFANVNPAPEVNEADKTVALTFFVDPGKRVQVRRILISGNNKTRDEVVRRELRQMEASWFNETLIKRSRERLERLGYFESVDVTTEPVPGVADQVDLVFDVKETSSGNFLAGLGFSQTSGIVLNTSLSQDNFLGSGKRVALAVNTGSVNTTYRFSFNDPYYTVDGISRGFGLVYRTTDAEEANVSRFALDEVSGSLSYGIPISDFDSVSATFRLENNRLETIDDTSTEIAEFINAGGNDFTNLGVALSYRRDTRNRALYPSSGGLQQLSGEITVPGSTLQFYKYAYRQQVLFPLENDWVIAVDGELAFGDGYGSTDRLPFFENYYAGGIRSVRGFRGNSIGPQDSNADPLGGSLRTLANVELIFPSPIADFEREMRVSAFMDAGTVVDCWSCWSLDDVRLSAGVGLRWVTPVGPLAFALGVPLNKTDTDQTEVFQFTIGVDF